MALSSLLWLKGGDKSKVGLDPRGLFQLKRTCDSVKPLVDSQCVQLCRGFNAPGEIIGSMNMNIYGSFALP